MPSSLALRNEPMLKAWNPPLSVRMGPGQRMNPCRPPRELTVCTPGRRYRW